MEYLFKLPKFNPETPCTYCGISTYSVSDIIIWCLGCGRKKGYVLEDNTTTKSEDCEQK